MKAALYIRVSTIEQAKEGNSLQAQSEALIDYAKKMNYEIVGEYSDDGASAASLNRPALQRLIDDIKQKRIDIVLIYKQDRLSRRVKDIIELVELFIKHNVKLHSLSETIDWLSSSGRAMLKMMATFSEMERENIAERSKMGKDFKARQGFYSNKHNIPIGYQWNSDTKELIPLDNEAEQVRKIYELYLMGWSIRKVSKYMSENYTNRYGNYQHRLSAKRILYNPIYTGYFLHKGELIKAKNIIPILNLETYLKAEKLREENRKLKVRSESPYLLVGMLRCGLCGQRYSAKRFDHSAEGKKYVYRKYGCEARLRFDVDYHETNCKLSPLINCDELEKKVIENVKTLEISDDSAEMKTGAIDLIANENSTIKDKIKKLIDLYEKDMISMPALEERLATYNKKLDQNGKLLKELMEEAKNMPRLDLKLIRERIANLDSLPFLEKRMLLRALIEVITITQDGINIKFKVK